MLLGADYPFLDILWTMFIFFLFVIWIWILITVFADIFRRKDVGGGSKALWIIFVIVLPYLGVLDLPDREPRRDGRPQHRADAEATGRDGRLHPIRLRRAVRREIEKAKGLLDSGAITQAEFDTIKAEGAGRRLALLRGDGDVPWVSSSPPHIAAG